MQEAILWAMKNTLLILGFLFVVLLFVAWLMMRKERRKEAVEISSFEVVEPKKVRFKEVQKKKVSGVAESWESEDHRALLVMCMGDKGKAERLIEFEKKKSPGAGRDVWIKEAIARWGRDLHRL